MQRKRSGLIPIGDALSDLGGPQSMRPVELTEDLQQQVRQIEGQVKLLAEDYREIAAVLSGG